MTAKMKSATPTILIVPGLREHVPDHWQTLLAAKLPKVLSVAPLLADAIKRINFNESVSKLFEG